MEEVDVIKRLRDKGNDLFKMDNFSGALVIYKDELLLDDIISLSNAAEAYLRLKDFPSAESQARCAIQKDISHVKSWTRLSRAIAAQGRLAEAHSLISTSPFDESVRTMQHEMCASSSPNTYHLTQGIFIKNINGVLGVYASRNFRSQDCLLKETSVTPWTKEDVWEDARLRKSCYHF
jgi:tetratricopeptide (TPR) repeat protein